MAWASHSLFYTFEISGGKEGLDLQLDSVKAERPEPVQLTWRTPGRGGKQSKRRESRKEKRRVIHGHRRESILVKEKSLFDF
jgi:hypothetical protein